MQFTHLVHELQDDLVSPVVGVGLDRQAVKGLRQEDGTRQVGGRQAGLGWSGLGWGGFSVVHLKAKHPPHDP